MVERIRHPIALLVLLALVSLAVTVSLREAHASSQAPQLPDLVADPPSEATLEQSEEAPTGGVTEAKLLLRFAGYVHNKGPGALDFRGTREAPTNPGDLASPPMSVYQRIYEYPSTEGPPPTSESTPHREEPSSAQMTYVSADGHNHWHLQHVAFYSLWNAGKTAEVAPAQKVGFCLEDSEHVEEGRGPASEVYSDTVPPYRDFCQREKPGARSLFEGISEGWRDRYGPNLAFQWVDVSDVLPGEYWLRSEVDPEHFVHQAAGPKPPAYAQEATIVPGFYAEAQQRSTMVAQPVTVKLSSQTWTGAQPFEQPSIAPSYEIVSSPAHGTLGNLNGNRVRYTPAPDYSGGDIFTFAARDPTSPFPLHPAVATVSIDVASPTPPAQGPVGPPSVPTPSVQIAGAPASMIAGTGVQLTASVSDDRPGVTWSSTAGSISQSGIYTAPAKPPAGGIARIAARAAGGESDQRDITILTAPVPRPKPQAPALLRRPGAMLIGRKLYMTALAEQAGHLRLTALLRGHRIARCAAEVRGHQAFTCTVTLPRGVTARSPISVWATLRVGRRLLQTVRPAAPVPGPMKAKAAIGPPGVNWRGPTAGALGVSWRGIARAWQLFCGM